MSVHTDDDTHGSDRVMVLDSGRIVEFASPEELLRKRDGVFYNMCRAAGLVQSSLNIN